MRVTAQAVPSLVLVLVSIVLATCALAACGGSTPPTTPAPEASSDPAPATGGTAVAADGAIAMQLACTEGANERCDALDDDCDGLIDEGCGYAEGSLTIVATWGSEADVDLVVTGPDGEAAPGISPGHGGRGACAEGDHPRIESATGSQPVAGTVVVSLRHVATCGDEDGAGVADDGADRSDNVSGERADGEPAPGTTTGSVSIALGGRVLGTFNVPLAPGATAEVATLTLTP
ncbi:MAG: hypothetical protein JRH11_01300 [Deltaproteobacteria bacterium]|nr:hypothetical protein [Deltaproteobacteria bacterium]